jgi:zinc transporter ZupT
MALAWLLTLGALAGVIAGVYLGQSRVLTALLSAAGGGLLFGIAAFWLIPKIGIRLGWAKAIAFALLVAGLLTALDKALLHAELSPRQGLMGPLLAAIALHSFLDGWSVRALAGHALPEMAVGPIGLALHKVPEGIATGWLARRSLQSSWKAVAASGGAQMVTLAGAFLEPYAERAGLERFGTWWPAAVLTLLAGSFLFIALHTLWEERRERMVVGVFAATAVLVGGAELLH